MDSEKKKNLLVYAVVIFLFIVVIFWDVFELKVSDRAYYWSVKPTIIATFIINFILLYKDKISKTLAFDFFCYFFFVYSFYGMVFLDFTYIFSFLEGFAFMWFFYSGSTKRYLSLTVWGFALLCWSINLTPNPSYIKEGYEIKNHLYMVGGIFAFISVFFYHFLNKQRLLLDSVTEKFLVIGKQSAFLLHELKTPLARFAKQNKEHSHEMNHLFSIISGIEMLVQKENVFKAHFSEFEWEEVRDYIADEFGELCASYHWELQLKGFEGQGVGQLPTIKLAVRNLVKNAIEAISVGKVEKGLIVIEKMRSEGRDHLVISNNGQKLEKNQLKLIFDPLHSTKKNSSNYGLGLSFVKSVAEAHRGSIKANRLAEMTVFEFIIPSELV